MKGYKTVIVGILIALTGALSTQDMQNFIAQHIPAIAGSLGAIMILLRAVTTSAIFNKDSA